MGNIRVNGALKSSSSLSELFTDDDPLSLKTLAGLEGGVTWPDKAASLERNSERREDTCASSIEICPSSDIVIEVSRW